eukprot:m.400607 g.400607  ORF g.400607 m.400607 type:complete len:116 (+) comp16784_c0_seq17:1404-1751(+)
MDVVDRAKRAATEELVGQTAKKVKEDDPHKPWLWRDDGSAARWLQACDMWKYVQNETDKNWEILGADNLVFHTKESALAKLFQAEILITVEAKFEALRKKKPAEGPFNPFSACTS